MDLITFKTFDHSSNFYDENNNEIVGTRRGILECITTTIEKVCRFKTEKDLDRTIALVLPCRYGKSDTIRLGARELIEQGLVSTCLVISPWVNLAKQVIASNKYQYSCAFYPPKINPETNKPYDFHGQRLKSVFPDFYKKIPQQEKTYLYSLTNGLAYSNLAMLKLCIKEMIHKTGLPPMIFIDEVQLLGEDKNNSNNDKWSKIALELKEAGAYICVLTGTPWRSDGCSIPGFTEDVLQMSSKRGVSTSIETSENGELYKKIDEWELVNRRYRVVADHEVTMRRAFDTKALLTVRAHWYEATVEIQDDDGMREIVFNKEPIEQQRRFRREVTKHPTTVKGMTKAAYENLISKRKLCVNGLYPNANSAMLVVTPPDEAFEESNATAKLFKKELERQARHNDHEIKVMIVTLKESDLDADEESSDKNTPLSIIQKFTNGAYDVLIVKQMGCVGLDAPRIKTVVFLGTFRTAAMWLQTNLRGATTWHPQCSHTDLILLDDADNRHNFEVLLSNEGGEYIQSGVEDFTVLNTIYEPYEEGHAEDRKPTIDVTSLDAGLIHSSDGGVRFTHDETIVVDHFRRHADGATDKAMRGIIDELINLQGQEAFDSLKERLKNLNQEIKINLDDAPEPLSKMADQKLFKVISAGEYHYYKTIPDLDERIKILAEDLEFLTKKYATYRTYEFGPVHMKDMPEATQREHWLSEKTDISAAIKKKVGFRSSPKDETDWMRIKIAVDIASRQLKPLLEKKYG